MTASLANLPHLSHQLPYSQRTRPFLLLHGETGHHQDLPPCPPIYPQIYPRPSFLPITRRSPSSICNQPLLQALVYSIPPSWCLTLPTNCWVISLLFGLPSNSLKLAQVTPILIRTISQTNISPKQQPSPSPCFIHRYSW